MIPTRWPFFYGWVIVGVAFLGSGIGSGVAIWGASVFVIPMTEELGWSRTAFFAAFTVRVVLGGLSAPLLGPLFDTRHGPRVLALFGAVVLAVSMGLLRYTDHLWQFILLYGVAGAVADAGSGFWVSQSIVPKWFVRKRGRALGIATMGVGLGALVFPGSVSALVDAFGWRDAWLYFGLVAGALSFLLALFVRTRPEDVGLLPDGDKGPSEREARPAAASGQTRVVEEQSLTRREALRTPAFWMLLASFGFIGLGIMGFQANWLPYLLGSGFSSNEAAAGIAIYGALSGLSRPLWGLSGERIAPRYLLAVSAVITAFSILLFLNVRSVPALSGYMVLAGVFMGGYLILRALLTADYFGRTHIGAVNGAFRPIEMGTSALSPLLFGVLYDINGNYTIAFIVAGVGWFLAGAIVLLAKPPLTRVRLE
ncbi:MAG: MFS transporter [Dehalococcoidia bacterium]